MKLNFANGTFFKHKLDFKKQAELLSKLDIEGVEVTFRYIEELDSCLKNDKFLNFLSKYKYNTIHSPFGKKPDIKIYKKDIIDETLDKLKKIAKRINAKNIVFHPYNFEDLSLLGKINEGLFTIENTITENMDSKELRNLFGKNDKLGFTLDTSHASYIGENEFNNLFGNLKDKIKTIHFSNAWKDEQHKQFFDEEDVEKFHKIKDLKGDIILTVEENFDDPSIDIINKEIKFIRDFFKSKN